MTHNQEYLVEFREIETVTNTSMGLARKNNLPFNEKTDKNNLVFVEEVLPCLINTDTTSELKKIKYSLPIASGGAFVGVLIGQIPGAIIGALIAGIYGLWRAGTEDRERETKQFERWKSYHITKQLEREASKLMVGVDSDDHKL